MNALLAALLGLAFLLLVQRALEGFGTLVTYQSGFLAQIIGVNWTGIDRKALESTNNATTGGARTYFASQLVNNGTLEVDLLFDPDKTPPIGAPAETVTVTWPVPPGKSTGATWSGAAFMIAMSMAAPLDDRMTQKVSLKWSGVITVNPSS